MTSPAPENATTLGKQDKKNIAWDWSWVMPTLIGAICVLVWLWFFTTGYLHATYLLPFDTAKSSTLDEASSSITKDFSGWVLSVLLFSLMWRWTNLLFLAVCASLVGEVGRWAANRSNRSRRPRPLYEGAFVRGFYVFLLTLTGQVIIAGGAEPDRSVQAAAVQPDGKMPPQSAVTYVDESRYFRLAGATSLLAFMGSFFPGFFRKLIDRYNPDDQQSGTGQSSPKADSRNGAQNNGRNARRQNGEQAKTATTVKKQSANEEAEDH